MGWADVRWRVTHLALKVKKLWPHPSIGGVFRFNKNKQKKLFLVTSAIQGFRDQVKSQRNPRLCLSFNAQEWVSPTKASGPISLPVTSS